jgi:hypothetical protein
MAAMASDLPDAPLADLDLCNVGRVRVNLLATSAALGHERVRGTLVPYAKREALSREGQIVYDVVAGRTPESAQRWFGSELDASAWIGSALVDAFDVADS